MSKTPLRPSLRVLSLEDRTVPANIIIDNFTGGQNLSVSGAGPASNSGITAGGTILGGERDTIVEKLTGPNGPTVQGLESGALFAFNTPLGASGQMSMVWDGADGNATTDALLLGADFSNHSRFEVQAETDLTGQGSQIRLTLVDTLGNTATQTLTVPTSASTMLFNFAAFAGIGGVNLASIGRLELDIINVPIAGDVQVGLIIATELADLSLTKAISPAGPYAVGDTVTYTVTVSNTGPNAATSVVVRDPVPAGFNLTGNTPSQGSYNSGTELWTIGTIASGASVTLQLTGTFTLAGSVSNYAEIDSFGGTDPDSTPGNTSNNEDDDDRVTSTVLGIDMGDAPTAAQSGFAASYPTTLANNGARHTATGPTLGSTRDAETDGQPNATATGDGADEDGVTIGSLGQGGNTSVIVNASGAGFLNAWIDFNQDGDWTDPGEQIASNVGVVAGNNAVFFAVPGAATVGNTFARFRLTQATAAGLLPTGAAPTGEVEDYQVAVVAGTGDLSLTKSVDNPTPTLGSSVVFTVTVTNDSATVTATGVQVRDQLPAGLTYVSDNSGGAYNSTTGIWTVGTLAPSASATILITATVSGSGTIVNQGEVFTLSPGDSDSTPGNGSTTEDDDASASITVPAVDFGDAPNTYGTNLASNGARHIASGVTLGATRDSEANAQAPLNGTGDGADEDGVTFPTFPNGTVLSRGTNNLITVSASAPGFLNAWLDTNNNGVFEPGEQVFTNQAVVAGSNSLNIAIPGTATLANTFARFRITDISLTTPSPTGLENSGEVEDYAIPIVDRADLSLTKTVTTNTPDIGDSVTFTLTVTNAGPSDATGISVIDQLPAGLTFTGSSTVNGAYNSGTGLWTGITLANGASTTLTITATVTQSGTINNVAQVQTSDQFDPDSTPGNSVPAEDDQDPETLTVPATDFGDAPTAAQSGFTGTYPTTLAQNGARHRATGPQLGAARDSENDGQPNATATGDGADEDGVGAIAILTQGINNTITLNVQNNPGTSLVNAWIDFNADGDWNDAGEQVITNQSVTGNGTVNGTITVPLLAGANVTTFARVRLGTQAGLAPTGLATDGEVEDYQVLLRQEADLSIVKGVSNATPDLGDTITYTITVTNGGPNPATGVSILDQLPAGVSFVSATPSEGAYNSGTGIWSGITLDPTGAGSTATLTITALVTQSGSIVNSAQVQTSDQFDPDSTPGDNSTTQDDDDPETITVPPTDFGDAPTAAQSGFAGTYPTTLAQNGARHRATGVTLGATRDSENDGQPNAGATGDGADEDGVSIGATVTIGTTQTIQVTASGAGFVNAWMDFNRDGDWNDAGELILTNQTVVGGLNSVVINIPSGATSGISFARFRITSASVAGPAPTGLQPDGEVEDYQVTLLRSDDFGDAPDTYGTSIAASGAAHRVDPFGPYLGANRPDVEADGQPTPAANGDDTTGTPDDEDGVTLVPLVQGATVTLVVNAPLGGRLDAFIDFAGNGNFTDAADRLTPAGGQFLAPGNNNLTFTVPATATPGTTFGRFRISTAGNLAPTAGAQDGEVEDYQVTINPGLATFGDRVWLDNNGDGLQTAGEPGISGATVTAIRDVNTNGTFGDAGDVTLTTTTDINGNYTFANVPNGSYQVTVTGLPGSVAPTFDRDGTGTPNVAVVALPPLSNLTDVDFGYRGTLSLGDRIWYDINANGAQDVGETGFTNVDVTLLGAGSDNTFGTADDFTQTTISGVNGAYAFNNLPAGSYRVTVDAADIPATRVATFDVDQVGPPTLDNVANVTLAASRTDVDFGYRGAATLGNQVFTDNNNDGQLNGADAGINGVVVELLNNAGTVIGTATTANVGGTDGVYLFPGLFDGTYRVRLAEANFQGAGTLVGFTSSTATFDPEAIAANNDDNGAIQGTLGSAGGLIITAPIVIVAGTESTADGDADTNTNLAVDFGVFRRQSLGNLVFNDANNNGIRDLGETGIDGVLIRLLDATGTTQLATATTAGGGLYNFTDLTAGTYVVEIAASNFAGVLLNFASSTGVAGQATPTPFEGAATPNADTSNTDGDDNGTTVGAGIRTAPITLGTNEPTTETDADPTGVPNALSNLAADFGVYLRSRITGRVFVDTNANGVQDPAETTGIAGVTVTISGPNGVTTTTTTNANGDYSFDNLPAGTYTVTETQPNGYGSSTPNTLSVVAPPGGVGTGNYGETTGSLAGRVWLNSDNQPTFNGPDAPLVGIVLTLTGTDANGLVVNRTTTTDATGNYVFANVVGGTYTITEGSTTGVGQPANTDGLDFIAPGSPGTAGADSHTVTLPAAQALTGYNFTEIPLLSTGGFVYEDLNGNGLRDLGEPGIAGVPVTITGTNVSGTAVNTTVNTLADGSYTFPNLQPSTNYTITEGTVPAPFLDGREQNGTPLATTVNNDSFSGINLTASTAASGGFHFGEVRPASIAGLVYNDRNNNGLQDSTVTEPGIAGVLIRLTGTDDLGNPVNTTTTTLANGTYSFPNLRPGTYTVMETQPATLGDGLDTAGNLNGSTAVNDVISGIVLTSGAAATGYNFGETDRIDIRISQTVSKSVVRVGEIVTITYVVTNDGPAQGNNVLMTTNLPAGLQVTGSNTGGVGTFNPATGQWTIGTLPAGESRTLTVQARVTRVGTFNNPSAVSATNFETNLANNQSGINIVASLAANQITKRRFLSRSF